MGGYLKVVWRQGLKGTKSPQAQSVGDKLFMLLKTSGQRWGEGGEMGQDRELIVLSADTHLTFYFRFSGNQLVTKMLSAEIQINFRPAKL